MVGTGRFELPNGETSHPTDKDPSAGTPGFVSLPSQAR